MVQIKITTSFPEFPIVRQTPKFSGSWHNCWFYLEQEIEECDVWLVYEDLLKTETTICPHENTILITGEPPHVKTYNTKFLQQFGTIITFRRDIQHPNIIYSHGAMPWHIGRQVRGNVNLAFTRNYDELSAIAAFHKDKLISVISSNKQITPAHKLRLEFVKYLGEHFADKIDIFGRGIRDIEDKWDAIAPYKYHVVLENGVYPDYFTEKLSDAFLGGAYPFYHGAPNLSDYFSEKSFTSIDIQQPEETCKIIQKKIEEETYEKAISEIHQARDLVLNKYNLFPMICKIANKRPLSKFKQKVVLNPANAS